MSDLLREVFFTVIRHGKAAPGPVDLSRPLTKEGAEQAFIRGVMLAESPWKVPELVLSSTAHRAQQTGRIILETTVALKGPGPRPEMHCHDWLYMCQDSKDQASNEKLFEKLMYAPPREYITHDETGSLRRFAKNAAVKIEKFVAGLETVPKSVAIFNHAVLPNLIMTEIFPEHREGLLELALGECSMFWISKERFECFA